MSPFRWIKLSLLLLQFAAVAGQYFSFIVRDGSEVTLPTVKVMQDQENCDSTNWMLGRSGNPVDVVRDGKINKAAVISDRLSVTENCSLVIKNVSAQDAGRYNCQSGQHDVQFLLSVIQMSKQDDGQWLTLSCLVSTREEVVCRHTVTWMYEGDSEKEDITFGHMQISQDQCSVTVTVPNSKSKHLELFKCKIKDGFSQEEHLVPFSPLQPSGEDVTTAITSTTTITENSTKPRTSTVPAVGAATVKIPSWWMYIGAALGLVALFMVIIIVAVIRGKRSKGNETQMDGITRRSLNPAVNRPGAESSQDTADPEDGVSYAAVSFKKKTDSRAQVKMDGDDDDEGDSVTYSTVKASSPGASADPSDLYASVKKANK